MSNSDRTVLAGVRILLVEDDPDTCDLLALILTSAGAEVVAVESAGEALEAFNRQRFDVLLSDAGLPDQDGWSLVETIRRMTPEHGGRTPAIALTAHAHPADEARSLAAGFDVHLTKPVDMKILVATIARLVRRVDALGGVPRLPSRSRVFA